MFNKTAIHVVCDIEINPNEASLCDHLLVRVLTMIEHVRTRKNNDDTMIRIIVSLCEKFSTKE